MKNKQHGKLKGDKIHQTKSVMFKKSLIVASSVVASLAMVGVAMADTLSTTTLGTAIDTVSSNYFDYFLVFITHGWGLVLGGTILVGIVLLAVSLARRMFHG